MQVLTLHTTLSPTPAAADPQPYPCGCRPSAPPLRLPTLSSTPAAVDPQPYPCGSSLYIQLPVPQCTITTTHSANVLHTVCSFSYYNSVHMLAKDELLTI